METFNIKGVEIFSVGKWNGDEYDHKDLEDIVQAFEETKDGLRPYVKLGHDPKQTLLQKDGLPAAGYIERLYKQGEKLVADFSDVPKKIYQLVEKKAYRKVSSEIFWNLKTKNKTYRRALGAVALLGANTPGVYNLADILSHYTKDDAEGDLKIYEENIDFQVDETKHYEEGETMPKSEQEIKLELELKAKQDEAEKLAEQTKQFEADLKARDEELKALKEYKTASEAEKQKLLADAETARIQKFVTDLKAEKLCSPAMEGLVTELLGAEKKEYTIKIENEDKKFSKEDLLKETLKLFKAAAEVNFEENSKAAGAEKKDYAKQQDEQVKKYMDEHKCSYKEAVAFVLNQQSKK